MAEQKSGEDLDRELIELLNEIRVTLPGVQVLFAFLLAVPFSQRFARVTDLQKDAYMASLLCTVAGSVFLIAPAAFHRIRFRDRDKESLLVISNRFAIAGTALLALAMTSAVFLVTDLLFKAAMTATITALVAGLFAAVWFALPLIRKAAD